MRAIQSHLPFFLSFRMCCAIFPDNDIFFDNKIKQRVKRKLAANKREKNSISNVKVQFNSPSHSPRSSFSAGPHPLRSIMPKFNQRERANTNRIPCILSLRRQQQSYLFKSIFMNRFARPFRFFLILKFIFCC
jgi:hypothetical protein